MDHEPTTLPQEAPTISNLSTLQASSGVMDLTHAEEDVRAKLGHLISSTSKFGKSWKLCIEYKELGPQDLQNLALVIQRAILSTLSLPHNKIGDEGAAWIASLLQTSTISYLDLRGNSISDAGAKIIASSLKPNSFLKGLDLADNPLTVAGVEPFCELLEVNLQITFISLPNVAPELLKKIGAGIHRNKIANVRKAKAARIAGTRTTLSQPVQPAPSHLICTACTGLFIDAVLLSPCGHEVCRSCIEKHVKLVGLVCPRCDQTLAKDNYTTPLYRLTNQAGNIIIRCPFEQCGAVMTHQEFQAHIDVCGFVTRKCDFQDLGCYWVGPQNERVAHQENCLFKSTASLEEQFAPTSGTQIVTTSVQAVQMTARAIQSRGRRLANLRHDNYIYVMANQTTPFILFIVENTSIQWVFKVMITTMFREIYEILDSKRDGLVMISVDGFVDNSGTLVRDSDSCGSLGMRPTRVSIVDGNIDMNSIEDKTVQQLATKNLAQATLKLVRATPQARNGEALAFVAFTEIKPPHPFGLDASDMHRWRRDQSLQVPVT